MYSKIFLEISICSNNCHLEISLHNNFLNNYLNHNWEILVFTTTTIELEFPGQYREKIFLTFFNFTK